MIRRQSVSVISLDGVSLMNPSPGLTLVGAVTITDTPLEMESHAPGFPARPGCRQCRPRGIAWLLTAESP